MTSHLAINREEWEAFKDWEACELDTSAFRLNFMTAAEVIGESGSPAPPLDEETEKHLLDEMEAWQEQQKAELLAFAERMRCSIYVAAFLRHLDSKLDYIAEVFGSNNMVRQKRKR